MGRTIILLFAFTSTASATAAPKDANRIIGGDPDTIQQYPFMANMQYSAWGVSFQPWWYLTVNSVMKAAHCCLLLRALFRT